MTNTITNAVTALGGHGIDWLSPEGITAIATCLAAIFALIALLSLVLLKRQLKEDHDRSRRERAVDLMTCFATSQDPTNHEIVFGLGLIYAMTKEQCHSLWARESFDVDPKNQHLLDWYRAASNGSNGKVRKASPQPGAQNGSLTVSTAEAFMLKTLATVYLNKLELVASAWNNNVADRDIIEQEFVKVFCPKDGVYVLENFREASGIYPSIGKICESYKNKKNAGSISKGPLG